MSEAATDVAVPAPQTLGHGRKLDDVMLAMDVVDTLRHNRRLVDRELSSEGRDAQLIDRLREIYQAQGIEVSDRILMEGVDALKEQRFSYEPAPPGFTTLLAKIYVKRAKWGWPLIIALLVVVVIWGGYHLMIKGPQEAALERQAVELTQEIPDALKSLKAEVDSLALVDQARQKALALAEDGMAAVQSGDLEAARVAREGLSHLRATLSVAYEIRIVSRPGEPSGVWRIPDANSNARNYYLIAEAVDAKGQVVTLPITSEEDGITKNVSIWGLRVPRAIFEAVGADKADDGIIQNNRLGTKQRGRLEPDYAMASPGSAILEW